MLHEGSILHEGTFAQRQFIYQEGKTKYEIIVKLRKQGLFKKKNLNKSGLFFLQNCIIIFCKSAETYQATCLIFNFFF